MVEGGKAKDGGHFLQVKELTLKEVKGFFDGRMIYRKDYFEQMPAIKTRIHDR